MEFEGAHRLQGLQHESSNVWSEYNALTTQYQAVSLGSGSPDIFPDISIVNALIDSALDVTNTGLHQYTRANGHPRLVRAVARLYSKLHGRQLDPMTNVVITIGAFHSLYCCFQALVNPGDEVIVIEPFFDPFPRLIRSAGGVPVFVPLRPPTDDALMTSDDWKLDESQLESKFNEKTKVLVLNTPNNPLGKVYTREELEVIARVVKKYNVFVVSDEVYEWLTFTDSVAEHIRIATLPGMWDRTISISSSGKTFHVTGWRTGWSVGPEHLLKHVMIAQRLSTTSCPTLIQEALSVCLEREMDRCDKTQDRLFSSFLPDLQTKRDKLFKSISETGMLPVMPHGGYFMIANIYKLNVVQEDSNETKDRAFTKWLIKNKKLSAIPLTTFFSPGMKHVAENYIRFCFMREDETLDRAINILSKLRF